MSILVLLITCILLVTLPTSVFPVSLIAAALLITAWWALYALRGGRSGTSWRGPCLPGLAILAYLCLTIIPLPLAATHRFGGERHAQNVHVAETVAALADLQVIDGADAATPRFSLSRNRAGTLRVAFLTALMLAGMMLAGSLDVRQRYQTLRLLILLGAAIAMAGVVSRFWYPQGDTLLWVHPLRHVLPGPLACFTNPNHFAGLMVLLLPGAIALLLHDLQHRRLLPALLSLTCLAALLAGLAASHSRGALLAGAVGMAAMIPLLLAHRRWKTAVLLLLFGVIGGTALLTHLPSYYRERLAWLREPGTDDSVVTRSTAWKDSRAILPHYPILGVGANGFRMIYPLHRSDSGSAQMTHAENEYVQLAVDGGAVGILLFLWLLAALARQAWIPAWRRPEHSPLMLGSLGAVMVAAVHSLFDFAPHIPLYSAFLAMITGLALHAPETDAAQPPPPPASPAQRLGSPALVALLLTTLLALAYGRQTLLDTRRKPGLVPTLLALRTAPTAAWAWYTLGREIESRDQPHTAKLAQQCMQRALVYDAMNYRLWYNYGLARRRAGDLDAARAAFDQAQTLRGWGWGGSVELGEDDP